MSNKSSKTTYYAVHKGYKPGIYTSWPECEKQIKKFVGAEFKKFFTKEEAQEFVETGYGNHKPKALTKIINADKANNDKIVEECNVAEDDKIYIYTDGSFIRGKPDLAGYGIFIPSKNIRIALPLINQKLTNNRAELTAIIESITYLDEDDLKKKICIFTDSQYSIYIMTGTGLRYAKNGYVDKSGKQVPNVDLIKKALNLLRNHNIVLLKVRSHTNATDEHSINNSIVDKLALEGAQKSKSTKGAHTFSDITFYIDNEREKDISEDDENYAIDSDEDKEDRSSYLKKCKKDSLQSNTHSTNFFKLTKSEEEKQKKEKEKYKEEIDEVEESIKIFKQQCKKVYNNNDKNYIDPSIQINELFDFLENKETQLEPLNINNLTKNSSKKITKDVKLSKWFTKSDK
jgi:ribonuclease HI